MAAGRAKSYAEAKAEVLGRRAKTIRFLKADSGIIEFKKFNPYHDRLGRFASANGAAAIFRSMADFMRPGGQFDLEAAKEDYRKFLQSVPEKNRMYLEQAMETVDFQEVNHPDVVFGYSEKRDAILYNPKNPAFAAYDSRVVLTHELGHRIDYTMFIESRENQEFSRAIQGGEKVVLTRAQEFVTFCEQQDEDGFLSDIFSAVCKDKTRFPFWHDESYWSEPGNRQKETFANLFALEAYRDTEKLELLETNLPELIEAYRKMF